eukprot:CAMPEP_0194231972 /NCGR_PEP_ID=MMETSP0158-20130606/514_1 /TAXON_ID=33649 /ORGANISM="Thalassionema nitzschioides, Strain L26-B" /LENGTH=161 /DNA_ID=CAMNT_0038964669 /DNA_START=18 /DNA_END=503 /DNA_ORIENTATION=+
MSLTERLSTIHDIVTQPRKRLGGSQESEWTKAKRQRIVTEIPLLLKSVAQRTKRKRTVETEQSGENEGGERFEKNESFERDDHNKEVTNTFVADKIVKDFISQVNGEVKTVEDDIQELEKKRLATIKKQSNVWETYLYGLQQISALADLRHAPDAIMPGNF